MSTDKNILIRMANQMGEFFEAMPDRPEALNDLATHIKRSWALRMRQDLLAYIDTHGMDELHHVTAQAVTVHRNALV
jgi:formate dehydrogenase subunit delta